MNRTSPKLVVATLTVSGLLLVGCSTAPATPAAEEDGTLVLYSNSTSDGRGDWLVARAAEAGFEVEYVEAGGGEISERIIAEKNNPIADVVFGPNTVQFQYMKDAEALETFEPEWADKVDAADPDGTYHSVVEEPIMLVYNTAAYPGGEGAPQDWTDLYEKERFRGTYETQATLAGGTTQMVIVSILARYRDDDGLLGVSDEGWAAMDQFFERSVPSIEGTDLYARMAAGEVASGQMWLAGKIAREQQYGVTSEPIESSVGVPMVNQNIGLVKGTDQPEQAEEFIDWFGSAEVQAAWSTEFFTAPTNADALADADQQAVELTAGFVAQDIDWTWAAENLSAWVEEIELNYLG
jgi:iron(III) transport system substrate-binding protein